MSIYTKTTKRIISVILIATMIFALSVPISKAESADERTGISIKTVFNKTDGKIYSFAEGSYYSTFKMPNNIATLEAWIYIPKSNYSIDCGVYFGNYAGLNKDAYVTYEVLKNGVPCLSFSDADGTVHSYPFTDAVIPADTWTHVTVVYGAGKNYKDIYCYINGEKKHTYTDSSWALMTKTVIDNYFSIAGDSRSLNSAHFTGSLGDIAVYKDVRTDSYIKNDLASVDLKDKSLMAYYPLFECKNRQDVLDKSGNGRDMYYTKTWSSEKEMAAIRKANGLDYAYSIAFIPDTQYMSGKNAGRLATMYDWIIANAKSRNIQYVLSMGDMTNDNTVDQWSNVKAQTDRLNGIVPYIAMRGNHDTTYNDGAEIFDELYSAKDSYYYNFVKENGGFYDEDSAKNVYLLFSVGNVDYMILSLDFGAGADIVLWANRLLEQYPDRRVIITTHAYLYADGTTLSKGDEGDPTRYEHYLNADYVDGEELWSNLIYNNPNVVMVACGHIHTDAIMITEAQGHAKNTVYQVLVDAQTTDSNLDGAGLVAMMYFTENGEFATFEYYSPVFDAYLCAARSSRVLQFPTPKEDVVDPPCMMPENGGEDNQYMTLILLSSAVLIVCGASLGVVITVVRRKKKNKE